MNIQQQTAIFKALGDSTRLHIVHMLSEGELCACKILERLEITQPTLSHHMKILCECGLVKARKDGKWSHYSLSCRALREFSKDVSALASPKGDNCK
ncbi:MAG: metalloregulator ArsR/SmtB family transcription factor [Oscillospiraceae bacterium]|nr:metalloregulator ArsR/SmtB family transcription factor [Oscillospiraceae bacterium]